MKSTRFTRILLSALAALNTVFVSGCTLKVVEPGAVREAPPAPYCSTVTTYTGATITVSGTAYYAPRDGFREVQDGGYRYRPTAAVAASTLYSITIAGTTYSHTTPASGATDQTVATSLAAQINADSAAPVTAQVIRLKPSGYEYWTVVNLKNYISPWPMAVARSTSANMTEISRTPASPIRHAEVMVLDSSGNIIQCGSTSATGTYSLILPDAASGTYTVQVNSRISNSAIARAYVMDYNLTNVHYSVSKSVLATASSTTNNLLASGEGAIISAAFNILDQVIKANEFLALYVDTTYGCGTTFADCTPYTPAPLVYIYWKKGVNPYSYYGVSTGSSFYTGDSRIFILGGMNGDVDSSDADHFDNSVIVHEYGHFLEDALSVSESPGGFHDGQSVIDPRLAWSEGFADFLQGAVSGKNYYIDTTGNTAGTTGGNDILNINLENTPLDNPSSGAEGLFREFSVTRLLWDAIDPHPATGAGGADAGDDVNGNANSMAEIWTVFTGNNGIKLATNPFRHMGTVHRVQDNMAGRTNWSTLRAAEDQNGSANYTSVGLREFATPLTPGVCSAIALDPVADGGTFEGSNLLVNNDFLSYYHGGGTLTVQLKYTVDVVSRPSPADFDLYVYNSDFTYGSSSTMAGFSQNARPTGCVATPANCTNVTETVSVSAPAGYYMINVMAYTGDGFTGGNSTYTISVNGTEQCLAP